MQAIKKKRSIVIGAGVTLAVAASLAVPAIASAARTTHHNTPKGFWLNPNTASTSTPIKHVVVIFGENVSFDHYFGTYPHATNPKGEPAFHAKRGTPEVNGLYSDKANGHKNLLKDNPNGANPQRLDPRVPADVVTCDQDHAYSDEQAAYNDNKMNKFPAAVGNGSGTQPTNSSASCTANTDLDYYDGNTVTAMWNYAQHYSMSENNFGTVFGPSTPGAIDVAAGDTGNVGKVVPSTNSAVIPDGDGGYSDISDTAPYYDDCPDYSNQSISMTGTNIGDQLNAKHLSWGWFEGGFTATTASSVTGADPGYVSPTVTGGYESGDTPAVCATSHNIGAAIGGTGSTGSQAYGIKSDYIAHHEPFQYYAATANPHHLAPASLASVGMDTQSYTSSGQPEFNTANHQYDTTTFNTLLSQIDRGSLSPSHLPAVTYLKAPGYEDAHAGYSDPLDEQQFVVQEVNAIEASPDWRSTAIFITYDDSDGWYDHQSAETENGGKPQNASQTSLDNLTGTDQCGTATPVLTNSKGQPEQGRCGYGPRIPLLVISPYAKDNYVSNVMTDQSSIVKFIEYNWHLGRIPGSAANKAGSLLSMFNFKGHPQPALYLNPSNGEPLQNRRTLQGTASQ